MTREEAVLFARTELNKYKLPEWGVRLNGSINSNYLGLCSYKDKVIILNAHHIDMHPAEDIKDTILHEIAHALTPGHQHDNVWAAQARELGCTNTLPCSNLSLPDHVIDAIRSGAEIEITFDEHVIRTPKYNVTRLQDRCEYCGKVAKSVSETTIPVSKDDAPDLKIIKLECGHTLIKKIPKGTPFHTFIAGGRKDCKHDWNKNTCLSCGAFRPYQFQLDGMKFLETALAVNKGGACFDEMGLGKTIQALGVLKFHPELLPALFIVKSGLKFQFMKQILTWMGDEFVPQIIQSSKDPIFPKFKTYIVGYDMLVPKVRNVKGKQVQQGFDISKFEGVIKTVVLDECQQIKNPDSTRTQQVRRIVKNTKVLPLSGTPWKNRGSELFPVFNMLDPQKFYSQQHFVKNWVEQYWDGNKLKEGGIRNPERFREFTKDICIRRERIEVMSELPLINRMKQVNELDDLSQTTYDEEQGEFVKWYNQYVIDGTEEDINSMHILAKLSKMRHIAGLAKIPNTMQFVEEFVEDTDRKLVIFVHHKDVGQILFDQISAKYSSQMPVMKLTSEMSGEERFVAQNKFNDNPRAILIASTLAAGEGLNLQTGADCVMHERQWNPANEEQAEGRFIRIGQKSTSVNATYVHADNSIDTLFDAIVERKRIAFHNSMNKGEFKSWSDGGLVKELADAIVNDWNKKNKRK